MVGASYAMVALLIGGYDRIPEWGFKAFLFGFTLIVSGMIFYSGKSASPYSFFYVWAALYALYFFTATDAARHVLFMGFCYAAVLVAHHWTGNTIGEFAVAVEDSAAQWTIAFGTLVVATGALRPAEGAARRPDRPADQRRQDRPAYRPAEPARLRGGVRARGRARAPARVAADAAGGRPRPLQDAERPPRPSGRRPRARAARARR